MLTEAEVEALAKAMYETHEGQLWPYVILWEDRARAKSFRSAWIDTARAAAAWFEAHYRMERKEA